MLSTHPLRSALCALAAAGLAATLSACGSGSEAPVAAQTTTTSGADVAAFASADVQVLAEDIKFPQKRYTAAAGDVTIGYRNDGRILHTLVIEDVDAFRKLSVSRKDEVVVGTVELEPGQYVLFCDIAGHRRAGMEATLLVE